MIDRSDQTKNVLICWIINIDLYLFSVLSICHDYEHINLCIDFYAKNINCFSQRIRSNGLQWNTNASSMLDFFLNFFTSIESMTRCIDHKFSNDLRINNTGKRSMINFSSIETTKSKTSREKIVFFYDGKASASHF